MLAALSRRAKPNCWTKDKQANETCTKHVAGRSAVAAAAAAITTTAATLQKREIFLLFTPRVFHDYFHRSRKHTCTTAVVGDRAVWPSLLAAATQFSKPIAAQPSSNDDDDDSDDDDVGARQQNNNENRTLQTTRCRCRCLCRSLIKPNDGEWGMLPRCVCVLSWPTRRMSNN